MRCVICLKTGVWPSRLKDVNEIDVVEEQLAHSEYVDEELRKDAIAHAAGHRGKRAAARHGRRPAAMSDPALGLLMLGLIVVVIMMGFPTAFTLMGLGMFFGFFAYYRGGEAWADNHIFDLMVQRTYGAMTNDVLISIPLFVLMGYVMERGALVDKMFYSIQLAFRRVPASLAVATLIVCTFWGIASGLVGAVVVLMGVIAFNPMLKAGYDVKLASGVITAGGTLGILIPPSVMIIVYAAVAGQSVVKLYAAAMFPGFFLAFLYLVYIIGWALINPKIAPKLPESETRVPVRPWVAELQQAYSRKMLPALFGALLAPAKAMNISVDGARIGYTMLLKNFGFALVPLVLTLATLWATWWYVVIHQQPDIPTPPPASIQQKVDDAPQPLGAGAASQPVEEKLEELGGGRSGAATKNEPEALQQMGSAELREQIKAAPSDAGPPPEFYTYFAFIAAIFGLVLLYYYWTMEAEQFEVLRLLISSVMPLGILTAVVLAVILLGITTATESAAVGAAGAFLLAFQARTLDWKRTKEAVFLTAKTTSMVCWLFVGSALFSAVFAILGGQALLESWVLSLNMTPVQFMILSQAIIFILGWPLEWTEIIVIFVPIFLPMLKHFGIDPILWGVLVFVNLQAAFLSPPVAMSAFYLKGVAPEARHAQPDLLRHDALHVHRHHLHGADVHLAGDDAVAAELSLRQIRDLIGFLLPVAGQHLLAGLADLRAVLLQADQNDLVAILHLRPAESLDVPRAGVLSHPLLRRRTGCHQNQGNDEKNFVHLLCLRIREPQSGRSIATFQREPVVPRTFAPQGNLPLNRRRLVNAVKRKSACVASTQALPEPNDQLLTARRACRTSGPRDRDP